METKKAKIDVSIELQSYMNFIEFHPNRINNFILFLLKYWKKFGLN